MEATPQIIGSSLEILAPYLPYGIGLEYIAESDIFSCEKGERSRLASLNWLGSPRVRLQLANDARIWVPVAEVLPVLRPFSALCDPLPDGTIPAKEVLLLIDRPRWAQLFKNYVKRLFVSEDSLMMEVDGSAYQLVSYNKLACLRSHLWGDDVRASVVEYLRRNHFAVGLEPEQYIPKSGGLPAIQEGSQPQAT